MRNEVYAATASCSTHGHPDHVSGVPAIKAAFGCEAAIHPDDREQLEAVRYLPGVPDDLPDIVCEQDLQDGALLRWHALDIEVVHTPGHTRGSVCFRVGPDLLSGDTLFNVASVAPISLVDRGPRSSSRSKIASTHCLLRPSCIRVTDSGRRSMRRCALTRLWYTPATGRPRTVWYGGKRGC